MAWLVEGGIAAVVVVALAVSWWFDRDARKRGATPLSGRAMNRARRHRDLETARQMSRVVGTGMTPKSQDAFRDAWRGKPCG